MTMDSSWLDVCKLGFQVGYMLAQDALWPMMVGSLCIGYLTGFLVGQWPGARARAAERKQDAGREQAP